MQEVAHAIGTDTRIGGKFLQAGVGFGGSCFRKDVLNLVYLSECLHLPEVAAYWKQVVEYNEYQKSRFARSLVESLFNTVSGKRIAVLGFAFKKNTGDTRESPSIDVCRSLLEERAEVAIYDPKVPADQIRADLGCVSESLADKGQNTATCRNVHICADAYEACAKAHALVVCTEWDEFRSLDFARIYKSMMQPAFVFDGRLILPHAELVQLGFCVHAIGKRIEQPSLFHSEQQDNHADI